MAKRTFASQKQSFSAQELQVLKDPRCGLDLATIKELQDFVFIHSFAQQASPKLSPKQLRDERVKLQNAVARFEDALNELSAETFREYFDKDIDLIGLQKQIKVLGIRLSNVESPEGKKGNKVIDHSKLVVGVARIVGNPKRPKISKMQRTVLYESYVSVLEVVFGALPTTKLKSIDLAIKKNRKQIESELFG